MKKKLLISLQFILLAAVIGCTHSLHKKEAIQKLEDLLKISMSDNIKVTDYTTSASISGDYTESFIVHLSPEEFHSIFKKVKPKKIDFIEPDLFSYTDYNKYNYVLTSAIFNPQNNTIKYSRHEE